jgi:hypothetical protein
LNPPHSREIADGGGAKGETGVAWIGIDAWVRPPRFRLQASVGATAAHEGGPKSRSRHGGHRCLDGRKPVDAKRPLSMKAVPDRENRCCSRGSGRIGLGSSRPGGPTRRRDKEGPTRTGRETRQGWQRSAASAASVDNTPGTVECLEAEANAARQSGEHGRSVCVPSPGHAVGPKACRFARGESLVDGAGSQRVRVLVVKSLGSRHRTNVPEGACPAARCKARRRERCLA